MKKKKGFELSINVLIIVILSIILLFWGVIFFNKLLTGANKIKDDYDQRTAEELEILLAQGEKVAIPFPRQDVRRGGKVVFGLGIYNNLERTFNFEVNVQCSTAFQEKNPISGACGRFSGGSNIVYYGVDHGEDITIKNNDRHTMPIAITFPGDLDANKIGTYVFNVCVCKAPDNNPSGPVNCADCKDPFPTNLYDSVHKIYVNVK